MVIVIIVVIIVVIMIVLVIVIEIAILIIIIIVIEMKKQYTDTRFQALRKIELSSLIMLQARHPFESGRNAIIPTASDLRTERGDKPGNLP